jgi:hypothetical protein
MSVAKPICPWGFLDTEPNLSQHSQGKSVVKSFDQALGTSSDFPLPQPCMKGGKVSLQISEEPYLKTVERCKNHLHSRLILKKGQKSPTTKELRDSINLLWSSIANWDVRSIGKGYFEFDFSSQDDLRTIWSAGAWNLKVGILRLSKWVPNFCPGVQKQTNAQAWIRLTNLPQEYWSTQTLFEIACGVGIPIDLDIMTRNRSFGQFARVLVDVDLSKRLHDCVLVERVGYAFHVGVVYEKMPDKYEIVVLENRRDKYEIVVSEK